MHRSATRPLSLLAAAAIAIAAAAPAQAFTPPLGSDKGSVTDSPTRFYDVGSPYLMRDPVAGVSPSAQSPGADGIIAILIG
jgi:hypothetical protein